MGRKKLMTYKRDTPKDTAPHTDGSLPFIDFVNSDRLRTPITIAAREIVALAKATVGRSDDARDGHYVDHFSINQIFGGHIATKYDPKSKRAIVEIVNDAKNAVMLEFGSGLGAAGSTGEREQGGWNEAKHPLARAGSKVGDFRE